jgi:dTDP-4-amino-4,6-dideoxygalactose transaminase
MGLAVLPDMAKIIGSRKEITEQYDTAFEGKVQRPYRENSLVYNYAYYPIVFKSEEVLLKAMEALRKAEIAARRYFFPSLNELSFVEGQSCIISEKISRTVLCLPLYHGLSRQEVVRITEIVLKSVKIC